MRIKLEDVIEQIEFANESNKSFFNKKTNEIHLIPEEVEMILQINREEDDLIPEWEKELIPITKDIQNNPDNYIKFPEPFEINQYSIMEKFCLSLADDELRDIMYSSIKGSGAFQRFRNNIRYYNIEENWYKYKDEAFREMAVDWCEYNGIEYY